MELLQKKSQQTIRMASGLCLVFSVLGIIVCYLGIKEEELFLKEGVQTQGIVTGISSTIGSDDSAWLISSHKLRSEAKALDYDYQVAGVNYTNHISYDTRVRPELKKGETIEITYLANNPSVSRYIEDKKDISDSKIFISILFLTTAMSIAALIWLHKKGQEI